MPTAAQRAESAVLWFLGEDLRRADFLRRRHVSDKYGGCAGCSSQTSFIAYPCFIRQLAEECIHRQIPSPRKAS